MICRYVKEDHDISVALINLELNRIIVISFFLHLVIT